jgi:hypothetical protein
MAETSLNIPNLDKLIAHLEAQPPERINMAFGVVREWHCGTCGCIAGHASLVWPHKDEFGQFTNIEKQLGLDPLQRRMLTHPRGYGREEEGAGRYPAHRVIATLKRLRDRFLATGEIVVDWGAEPSAGEPWAAPRAVEITPPALPETLTRLLAADRAPATEVAR